MICVGLLLGLAIGGVATKAGAFVACLIVSTLVTPIAERLHLPYAGIAFASVVCLIPGVLLFRMSGGLLALIALGAKPRLQPRCRSVPTSGDERHPIRVPFQLRRKILLGKVQVAGAE
jgi:hypothetical protein